jgi:hypothetical protein
MPDIWKIQANIKPTPVIRARKIVTVNSRAGINSPFACLSRDRAFSFRTLASFLSLSVRKKPGSGLAYCDIRNYMPSSLA